MENIQNMINKIPYSNSIFLTVILLVIYIFIKRILMSRIDKNKELGTTEKILTTRKIRDYGRIILLMCIFFLWFAKLQTVFISLLAVAAAIVIALKEIIMCFTGGMLIRLNNYFKLDDRIEVDGIRGFVINKSLTATKILEIGPEKNSQQTTGNIISIPNSVVLSKPLSNESYFQDFSIKTFMFIPHSRDNIEESEQLLLQLGLDVCSNYLEKAKRSITSYCRKEGIAILSVEPRVKFVMTDNGDIKLLLKIPVDNKHISDIEQKLIKSYFSMKKQLLMSYYYFLIITMLKDAPA